MLKVRRVGAIVGAGVLAVTAIATPAMADEAASGSCTTSGHFGNGATHYYESGYNNRVPMFAYYLGGDGTRGESNTNIRHYENRTASQDRLMYAWNSPDDRKNNFVYKHVPPIPVELLAGRKQHSDYYFIFDELFPDDPKCLARTTDYS